MQYNFGYTVGVGRVAGIWIHLGPKEILGKVLPIKTEDWNTWSKKVTDSLQAAGDTYDDAATTPCERHEVIIERNNAIQMMTLADIKPVLCGAAK